MDSKTTLSLLSFFVALTAACTEDTGPGMSAAAGAAGTPGTAGSGGAGGAPTDGGGGGTTTDDGGDGAVGDAAMKIASSTGMWVIYPDPYGDGGAANPIMATIAGKVDALAEAGGKMRLVLSVTGLPPNRDFGSHLHKLACDNNKAGGHYQNMPFPDGGSANDPTYANAANEAWLDFTTDANGAGASQTIVNWVPRAGEAKAVVIHDMKTADGGVAGAKLACINIPF
jgi:Cu-Zn family superoxide dismutase